MDKRAIKRKQEQRLQELKQEYENKKVLLEKDFQEKELTLFNALELLVKNKMDEVSLSLKEKEEMLNEYYGHQEEELLRKTIKREAIVSEKEANLELEKQQFEAHMIAEWDLINKSKADNKAKELELFNKESEISEKLLLLLEREERVENRLREIEQKLFHTNLQRKKIDKAEVPFVEEMPVIPFISVKGKSEMPLKEFEEDASSLYSADTADTNSNEAIADNIDKEEEASCKEEMEVNTSLSMQMYQQEKSEYGFYSKLNAFLSKLIKGKSIEENLIKNKLIKDRNNYKKVILSLSAITLIMCLFTYKVFQYWLSPQQFIVTALSNEADIRSAKERIIVYPLFDKEYPKDKNLDATLTLDSEINTAKGEVYNKYILSSSVQELAWERYYKDENMILKTPYVSTYISVEDYNSMGFTFNKSENKHINANFFTEFIKYLPRKFISKAQLRSHEGNKYYFELNINDEISNQALSKLWLNNLNSSNFQSFLKEEEAIRNKLKVPNKINIGLLSDLSMEAVKKIKVNNSTIYININNKKFIESIEAKFNITYTSTNAKQSYDFDLCISMNRSEINEDFKIERTTFSNNNIDFSGVNPRPKTPKAASADIFEAIGTVEQLEKDLEKNNAVITSEKLPATNSIETPSISESDN